MKFAIVGKKEYQNKYLVVILDKAISNNSNLYNCRIIKPKAAVGDLIQCEFEDYNNIKNIEDDPDALSELLLYYELGD